MQYAQPIFSQISAKTLSDWHETKRKHIVWALGFKYDHRIWSWPWPWIANLKYEICYISAPKWSDCKRNEKQTYRMNPSPTRVHRISPLPWPWSWIFRVKFGICCISDKKMVWLQWSKTEHIDWILAPIVTIRFDLGHYLDLAFSRLIWNSRISGMGGPISNE